MTSHPVSPAAVDDELPIPIYSSPGSRWVDPALGCKWPSNMPPLHEVLWPIGGADVQCGDPALTRAARNHAAAQPAARAGRLHRLFARRPSRDGPLPLLQQEGGDRLRQDRRQQRVHRGWLRSSATQCRGNLRRASSHPDDADACALVADGRRVLRAHRALAPRATSPSASKACMGVPVRNAYFNSLFRVPGQGTAPRTSSRALSTLDEQMEYLSFEPMLQKQIDECPAELRPSFVQQVMANVQVA